MFANMKVEIYGTKFENIHGILYPHPPLCDLYLYSAIEQSMLCQVPVPVHVDLDLPMCNYGAHEKTVYACCVASLLHALH